MYTNASRVTTCSYTLTALSTTLLSYTAASLVSIISPHSPTHLPTLHTSWQQKSWHRKTGFGMG